MRHVSDEPPHLRIAEPTFTDTDIAQVAGDSLERASVDTDAARRAELDRLVAERRRAIPLSEFVYAMAAVPLALQPIQKIRFVPYALVWFRRFLATAV